MTNESETLSFFKNYISYTVLHVLSRIAHRIFGLQISMFFLEFRCFLWRSRCLCTIYLVMPQVNVESDDQERVGTLGVQLRSFSSFL